MQINMQWISEAACPEERKALKTVLVRKSHFHTRIVYLHSLLLLLQPSLTSLFSGVGSPVELIALSTDTSPGLTGTQLGTPVGEGLMCQS